MRDFDIIALVIVHLQRNIYLHETLTVVFLCQSVMSSVEEVFLYNTLSVSFLSVFHSAAAFTAVRWDHPGPQQHLFGGYCRAQHSQYAWWLQPVGGDEEEEALQPHEQEGS